MKIHKKSVLFVLLLVVVVIRAKKSEQILTTQTITFFIDSGIEEATHNRSDLQSLVVHRQNFNQSTINYCNFDPFLLNSKRKSQTDNLLDSETTSSSNDLDDFKVNLLMSTHVFNESSQITVNVQFKNKQAESSKLWYLLEAKSVCTNQVLGLWRLKQHKNTDTIYCFNPDDTLFGHKSQSKDTLFQQTWIPVNTFEDVYFVLATFTDEIYSDLNPNYYLVSSSILKYKNKNTFDLLNDDNYDAKCSKLNDFNFFKTSTSISTTTTSSTTPTTTTTTLTTTRTNSTKMNREETSSPFSTNNKSTQLINRLNHFKSDRTILVDLVGTIDSCTDLSADSNLTNQIRIKLEKIYKKLVHFKRLEIVNIFNKECTSNDSLKRNLNTQNNVVVQHYVHFDEPIKNETKLYLVNSLKSFLLTAPRIDNLDLVDSYLPADNGTRMLLKSLNNSCDLYDYFSICQNGGACNLNANSAPTCICQQTNDNQNYYWSGKFCDVKVDQTIDSDKIKMFITIGCLASFAIISLLSLLIYVLYKKRKHKKTIKKVINERSKICTSSSSNETSINDEFPRLNNYNSNLNTISYPRELIIASSPIKKYQLKSGNKLNETDQTYACNTSDKKSSEQYAEHAHINYAYNFTFNSDYPFENDTFKKRPDLPEHRLSLSSISANSNFNLKAFWKNDPKNLDDIIHQKSTMYKNNERKLEVAKIINNIPFSFEKQMARNFHNLTYNSSPGNSTSLETGSSEFINRYSKYTDTTSISSANQSLKDEDAWLPILNLAEEQILKYQNEEAKDMEYCLM